MQPYFFPYIGYFQLINAVDKFIFYDDVNFIKNGWINRNRVLVNNKPCYLTVKLKNASSNSLIKDIKFIDNRNKLIKTIELNYKRAPYFKDVFPLIEIWTNYNTDSISDLAIYTIKAICSYLNINKIFEKSSLKYSSLKGENASERIIKICHSNKAETYINPIGGITIYNKNDFLLNGIHLYFLNSNPIIYNQYNNQFVSSLSIIDVIMFNPIFKIKEIINNFELI